MIDRKLYLTMCRDCAILREEATHGIKKNVPDELRVVWKGGEYYPQQYVLGFNDDGTVSHVAVLHSLSANSVVYVPLSEISRKGEENG